jgi:hypothetical protein
MRAKEMALTGLALSLLACWEVSIGEIPLGLFSISHAGQTSLFDSLIVLKLLVSALLISRSLLHPEHAHTRSWFALAQKTAVVETKAGPCQHRGPAPRAH